MHAQNKATPVVARESTTGATFTAHTGTSMNKFAINYRHDGCLSCFIAYPSITYLAYMPVLTHRGDFEATVRVKMSAWLSVRRMNAHPFMTLNQCTVLVTRFASRDLFVSATMLEAALTTCGCQTCRASRRYSRVTSVSSTHARVVFGVTVSGVTGSGVLVGYGLWHLCFIAEYHSWSRLGHPRNL